MFKKRVNVFLVLVFLPFFTVSFYYARPLLTRQTVFFYLRYFMLRKMFVGPLQDWWGELDRTSIVERRGGVVYTGLGTYLGVLEMSAEGKLKFLKKISLLGFVHGFAQDGDMLYVVSGATGLNMFDVSDPRSPRYVGRYMTHGYALWVAVSHGYAYVADEEGGLVILNVGNPSRAFLVKHLPGGNVNMVLVSKNKAYLADGERGIVILDVQNPKSPRLLGICDVTYHSKPKPIDVPPLGLALLGNTLLVANGERGLDVVDVSNPGKPRVAAKLPLGGFSYSVALAGGVAFVADIVKGVIAVDVRDAEHPVKVGEIKASGQPFDVLVWEQKLLISAGAGGLQVMDISHFPSKSTGVYQAPPTTFGVTVRNGIAFTANGTGGMNIYDVKNPKSPRLLSHVPTPGYAHRIILVNALAYVADVIGGAHAVDISNPRSPKVLNSFDWQQHPWDIAYSRGHVFIADAHHGFSVFNVSNPKRARFISNFDLARYTVGVEVEGNYAYLADMASFAYAKGGLFIFDISEPSNLKMLGSASAPAVDVDVVDKTVYLAGYKRGLIIVDAREPLRPKIVGRYKTGGYVYGVHVVKEEKKAYVADYKKGILVLDVQDPQKPVLQKAYRTNGTPYEVYPYKGALFVADGKKGLAVIDSASGKVVYPDQ